LGRRYREITGRGVDITLGKIVILAKGTTEVASMCPDRENLPPRIKMIKGFLFNRIGMNCSQLSIHQTDKLAVAIHPDMTCPYFPFRYHAFMRTKPAPYFAFSFFSETARFMHTLFSTKDTEFTGSSVNEKRVPLQVPPVQFY